MTVKVRYISGAWTVVKVFYFCDNAVVVSFFDIHFGLLIKKPSMGYYGSTVKTIKKPAICGLNCYASSMQYSSMNSAIASKRSATSL